MDKKKSESKHKTTSNVKRTETKRTTPPSGEKRKAASSAPATATKTVYRHRNFAWCLFAVCLAFVLGICSVFGAIGIGLTAVKTKDVLTFVNLDADEYVAQEYQNKTLLELGLAIVNDAQSGNLTTAEGLGKYSPKVDELLNAVADNASKFGVKLDLATLKTTQFADLATYLQETVLPAVEIGGVLGLKKDSSELMLSLCYGKEGVDYTFDGEGNVVVGANASPLTVGDLTSDAEGFIGKLELGVLLNLSPDSDQIMLALCYGTEGEDYTVSDGKIVMNEGKTAVTVDRLVNEGSSLIDGLEVATLLGVSADSNSALRYLAFGTQGTNEEGGDYIVVDGEIVMNEGKHKRTVADLTAADSALIEGARIADLVTVDETSSKILQSIADWTVADLTDQSKIDSLTLSGILEIDESSSNVMQALKDKTIAELTSPDTINNLTLSDVLTIDETSSGVIKALKDTSIGDLAKAETVDNLLLSDVIAVDETSPAILQTLCDKGTTVGGLGNAVNALTLAEILGDSVYESDVLKNLADSTLSTLVDDVNALTLDDLFGEEMYSYTLTDPATSYANGTPPVAYTGTVVTVTEGTAVRYQTEDGQTLYRYTQGFWWLIVGDDGSGGNIKLTELAPDLTALTAKINNMKLSDLYIHGILTDDPSVDISKLNYKKDNVVVQDLKDLTILDTIDLIYYITRSVEQLGG